VAFPEIKIENKYSLVFAVQPRSGTSLGVIGERLRALSGVHGIEVRR
jgi:hypothetical protein